mmetsp:Transcript_33869/g.71058  ORF Transcript_33869/g.71058 Transcript_33869/m.71058 type:complete len:108 (-) Transcript_33869:576-899(-)
MRAAQDGGGGERCRFSAVAAADGGGELPSGKGGEALCALEEEDISAALLLFELDRGTVAFERFRGDRYLCLPTSDVGARHVHFVGHGGAGFGKLLQHSGWIAGSDFL